MVETGSTEFLHKLMKQKISDLRMVLKLCGLAQRFNACNQHSAVNFWKRCLAHGQRQSGGSSGTGAREVSAALDVAAEASKCVQKDVHLCY